jgi:hypothetical protein
VTLDALLGYAPLWRRAEALEDSPPEWQGFNVQELGWMEPSRYVQLVRNVVRQEILAPLRELGLILPEPELERLLA